MRSWTTLIQPGSGKSRNYRGPFSFDLAFMRCKLTSPVIWQMCYRSLRFRKFAQNGAEIYLERVRNRPDWKPTSPPLLYMARDQKLIGMLPDTTPHCGPRDTRMVCNDSKNRSKAGRSAGSRRDRTSDEKRQNGHQKVIFRCHVRSSKRFSRRFGRNRSIKKKSDK